MTKKGSRHKTRALSVESCAYRAKSRITLVPPSLQVTMEEIQQCPEEYSRGRRGYLAANSYTQDGGDSCGGSGYLRSRGSGGYLSACTNTHLVLWWLLVPKVTSQGIAASGHGLLAPPLEAARERDKQRAWSATGPSTPSSSTVVTDRRRPIGAHLVDSTPVPEAGQGLGRRAHGDTSLDLVLACPLLDPWATPTGPGSGGWFVKGQGCPTVPSECSATPRGCEWRPADELKLVSRRNTPEAATPGSRRRDSPSCSLACPHSPSLPLPGPAHLAFLGPATVSRERLQQLAVKKPHWPRWLGPAGERARMAWRTGRSIVRACTHIYIHTWTHAHPPPVGAFYVFPFYPPLFHFETQEHEASYWGGGEGEGQRPVAVTARCPDRHAGVK